MMLDTETVEFEVAGETVVGVLRRPHAEANGIGVVTLGPLTSVKEQAAGAYALSLAHRGFTTLAFDPRSFGESTGTPRQLEHPPRKAQDAQAAAALLRDRGLRTVTALGVCAGAGYMSGAVADGPFSAFVGVAGFYHDAQQQQAWMGEGFATSLEEARLAREAFERGEPAAHIPAVGKEGDVAMPLDEAFEYYGTSRGAVPNYTNAFAVMSREYTLPWDAQAFAPRIQVPTLVIHSDNALAPALARKFHGGLGGPSQLEWTTSKGQIDFYDDPERIEPASERAAAFLRSAC